MPSEEDETEARESTAPRPAGRSDREGRPDPAFRPAPADAEDDGLASEDEPAACAQPAGVPVVGIGASAGGIEALAEFFAAMTAASGLAFVVVLHLDPTKESRLAEVLGQHARMPVAEVEDGMALHPDHVYVIAPDRDLVVDGDALRLVEPSQPRGRRHPVDALFTSLAEQRGERAAAVILSGSGTNGTQGAKEVAAAGGLVLVQDPTAAAFDGMPRSAIRAGVADEVLPAGGMPDALLRHFTDGHIPSAEDAPAWPADGGLEIGQVLALLRAHTGHDLRGYRPHTLLRRISRRMSLKGLADLDSYLDLLRSEPREPRALVRDLLINVTSFFRDREAWEALDETVIRPLVAERDDGASIRVWAPACSTGEEAYSVAMLLTEAADAAHKQFDLKVFASDILDDNLEAARTGLYPAASVETMPSARARRFFDRQDSSYQVSRSLRDTVVFARQDLLRDPPFSRMDLITCRNVLIYVEPEAQRRAIGLFHFALRDGGRLFLGSAETVGRADDLFETVSKKWRIFRRLGPTRHDVVTFPLLGTLPASEQPDPPFAYEPQSIRVAETARRALLDRYAPASVLVDGKGRVVYFHGDTGPYLKQPGGEPTRDLVAMARDGLLVKLRAALAKALVENQDNDFKTQVGAGDATRTVRVSLSRIRATPRRWCW